MEIGYDQAEAVEAMLRQNRFIDIEIHKDLNGIARFPIARLPGSPPPIDQEIEPEQASTDT